VNYSFKADWKEVKHNTWTKLSESMPWKMAAVIKNKGEPAKY